MDAQSFLDNFAAIADGPDGVQRLRDLVLDLAVGGRLVEQDPAEGAGKTLLAQINDQWSRVRPRARTLNQEHSTAPPQLRRTPSSWGWALMRDLQTKMGAGSTPLGGQKGYVSSGVAFLRSQNVWNDGLRLHGVARIPREVHERMAGTAVQPGDVLLNITGASIGRSCVVPPEFDAEANVSQHVAILRQVDGRTSSWIHLFLISPHGFRKIMAGQVGISREGLSMKRLSEFAVPIPPLAEQVRILAKVDDLMKRCDELESRQKRRDRAATRFRGSALHALAEAETPDDLRHAWDRLSTNWQALTNHPASVTDLRETMIQLAVEGRVVPQEPTDEPASELLEACRQRSTELIEAGLARSRSGLEPVSADDLPFELPVGWTLARLDQWCDIAGGLAIGRKLADRPITTLPYLRVANVKAGYLALDEVKEIEVPLDEVERYSLQPGDVLLTEGGDWDKLGRSAIWTGEIDPCLHQNHIFRARPLGEELRPEWVSLFTNSRAGRTYFQSKAKRTTNLASINMTELRSMPLPVPPAAEQLRILATLATLLDGLTRLERSLSRRDATQRLLATGLAGAVAH